MRDGASTNGVAITVSYICGFSHTIDHVGDYFCTRVLDFISLDFPVFPCPMAKLYCKLQTGIAMG